MLKAYANSDISLETTAIFFQSNRNLKQGIDSVYVMVEFICMGLLDGKSQNRKLLPTVEFEPGPFDPLTKRSL